jgi:hypothetical protein
MGVDGRYTSDPLSTEDTGYLSHDFQARREEHGYARRASFAGQGSVPASWHPSMAQQHPSRSLHSQFASGMPSHTNSDIHAALNMPTSSPLAMNRLPPDSTLLTPLPGYEPPTLLPPLQARTDGGYDGYDNYGRTYVEEGRPSTGHASLGGASANGEYDI